MQLGFESFIVVANNFYVCANSTFADSEGKFFRSKHHLLFHQDAALHNLSYENKNREICDCPDICNTFIVQLIALGSVKRNTVSCHELFFPIKDAVGALSPVLDCLRFGKRF